MTYTQVKSASDITAKPAFLTLMVLWARHVQPLMDFLQKYICSSLKVLKNHMNRPVVLQPATRTLLKPSRTKSPTRNELRYVQSQIHVTKYINNIPNYHSTNETYYTQENTMITKHKR